jgi:uncharacterized membrane protein YdjX (TVP38/TMEM64 family)
MNIFTSVEGFKALVLQTGPWGPVVFVALQILQVFIFVLPGEIAQIAGGYLFGLVEGTLLSLVGISLGSLLNFTLAQVLGKPFVNRLFGKEKLGKFEAILTSSRMETAFFLLFLIPGIPKDILCYVAGLSTMKFPGFLGVSMLGRLPGIVGSTAIGQAAGQGNRTAVIVISLVAALLFILGMRFHERIHGAIYAISRREKPWLQRKRTAAAPGPAETESPIAEPGPTETEGRSQNEEAPKRF